MQKIKFFLLILLCLLFPQCNSKKEKLLRIAASAIPHAEMLEFIKQDLENYNIHLAIVILDDYQIPNRALNDHEVDANFFQHKPFLEEQIKQFGYNIEEFAKIEIEPMGIYSKHYLNLSQIQKGNRVAVPNDPSNQARALLLLESKGFIQLKKTPLPSVMDIVQNCLELNFIEVDAALLPRILEDVSLAIINTNYALQAGLSPVKNALALENIDSPYANILVIRKGEETREDLQKLKHFLTSPKMKDFILKKYKGEVIPTF